MYRTGINFFGILFRIDWEMYIQLKSSIDVSFTCPHH